MFHLLPNTRPSSVLLTIGLFSAAIAGILFWQNTPPARPHTKPVFDIPGPHRPPVPTLLFDVHEVAGSYYFGDGLGVNCTLEIRPDHQFHFQWRGCMGVYDTNSGAWELQGDVLVCKPDIPNEQEGFAGMNLRFVPVKWGQRHYLIDENEMPGFCAAAASGGVTDELHGNDYVKREGDKLPPVQGTPVLPDRYHTFYNQGAVKAQVVAIDGQRRITLNKGRAERIRTGMLLAKDAFENSEVKILSVTEHTALAEARYFWNSDRRIRIGDKFTTGGYWNRPHGTKFKVYSDPPELPRKKRK